MLADDLQQFGAIPPSTISEHNSVCCVAARVALLARIDTGSAHSTLASIPQVVAWEPVAWPVHWCELRRGDDFAGDCGVHAALARVVLEQHAVANKPAQIALTDADQFIPHWRSTWNRHGVSPRWLGSVSAYHEVLSIGGRYWDPTEARWFIGVGARLLAGRVIALREDGPWTMLALKVSGA